MHGERLRDEVAIVAADEAAIGLIGGRDVGGVVDGDRVLLSRFGGSFEERVCRSVMVVRRVERGEDDARVEQECRLLLSP